MDDNTSFDERRGKQLDSPQEDLILRIGSVNLDFPDKETKLRFLQVWEVVLHAEDLGAPAYLLLQIILLEHRIKKLGG
jgi:hypothetical protein